jgi:hypothetical protein
MSWVALSKSKHFDRALSRERNYWFSNNLSLAPIYDFEVQRAVSCMPLVFTKHASMMQMCGVLGLKKNRNVFVNADGSWEGDFVPAVFRAYPFAIGELNDKTMTVLFSEESKSIVERGFGDPFFNEDGTEGAILKSQIELLSRISRGKIIGEQACSLLGEFDLFEPLSIGFEKTNGGHAKIQGLSTIAVEKFRHLEEEKFLNLRKTGALDLIYAHFYSMNNINRLTQVMSTKSNTNLENLGQEIFGGSEKEFDFNFS